MPPHAGAVPSALMPISVEDLEALEDRALSIAQLTTIGLLSLFAEEASRVGAKLARPSTEFALCLLSLFI
jgi:hypothetical protein